MSTRRRFAAVVLALLAWSAGPAAAHEGKGALTLEESATTADDQVRYVVRLITVSDGHAAVNATVTATLVAADGTARTPVPLPALDEDGRYGTTITFPAPGSWTVRFTAVKPPATLAQPVTIAAPTTTTTAATTTTNTTAAVTTTSGTPDRDTDGSGAPVAAGIVAAGGVAVGAGVWAARRRRNPPG